MSVSPYGAWTGLHLFENATAATRTPVAHALNTGCLHPVGGHANVRSPRFLSFMARCGAASGRPRLPAACHLAPFYLLCAWFACARRAVATRGCARQHGQRPTHHKLYHTPTTHLPSHTPHTHLSTLLQKKKKKKKHSTATHLSCLPGRTGGHTTLDTCPTTHHTHHCSYWGSLLPPHSSSLPLTCTPSTSIFLPPPALHFARTLRAASLKQQAAPHSSRVTTYHLPTSGGAPAAGRAATGCTDPYLQRHGDKQAQTTGGVVFC